MSLHISILRSLSHVSCQIHDLKVRFQTRNRTMHHYFELFFSFLLVHNSKQITTMYMNLLESIEGVYVSAYFKSQTLISFFLSATWFQSWVPDTKPHNTPQFRAFFSFSLVHNSKYISAMYMKLSETIEGVYVSAYFKSQTFLIL